MCARRGRCKAFVCARALEFPLLSEPRMRELRAVPRKRPCAARASPSPTETKTPTLIGVSLGSEGRAAVTCRAPTPQRTQLLAMDILALATMKNAAKCDT